MDKIILIIIIVFLLIFFKSSNNEPFDNICQIIQTDTKAQIIKNNIDLIINLELDKIAETIIKPFHIIEKIDSNITVEEYLLSHSINPNQINNAIILIKAICDNNCLMSALIEYEVTNKTKMISVIQTFLLDCIYNNLICLTNDKKSIQNITEQIIILIMKPYVEVCSQQKFIEFCETNYIQQESEKEKTKIKAESELKKQVEQFSSILNDVISENNNTVKILEIESKVLPLISNSSKFTSSESIDKIITTFNSNSLGVDIEPYLKEQMSLYKDKYKKDLNISIKSDFSNFIKLFIENFKELISIILGEKTTTMTIDAQVNKFNAFRSIYYQMKYYYKLVSLYELVNINLKTNDEKLQAMLCCSKSGEKSCINFGNKKNPSAIIYGFDEYGYVKSSKCIANTPEAKVNIEEQNKIIDDILSSKYELWGKAAKENKIIIYGFIANLFKLYNIQIKLIDTTLGDVRKQILDNRISVQEILQVLPIKQNNIMDKFNATLTRPEYILIINSIDKCKNNDEVSNIIYNNGFTREQIVFNSNVSLDVTKAISVIAIYAKFLFSYYNYPNSSETIMKIMGISKTNQTFNEIFASTKIIPRYYFIILEAIIQSMQNSNIVIISKYDMNSIPLNVIKYTKSKPTDKTLNLCNIYSDTLNKLRKNRSININEYNDLEEKINFYCNPEKIPIEKINSTNVPLNDNIGINILERKNQDYTTFSNEYNKARKNNVNIVSDEILYNFIKNTYNT